MGMSVQALPLWIHKQLSCFRGAGQKVGESEAKQEITEYPVPVVMAEFQRGISEKNDSILLLLFKFA